MPGITGLDGKRVAVPEGRQLQHLATLLRNRGAEVLEVPLVSILDAPDARPVEDWLRRFVANPPDLFILLTGEGLRRLLGFAERADLRDAVVAALGQVRKLSRGPKPDRVLRDLGLRAEELASTATTEGVIATLDPVMLTGCRVAVQLYGEEPNRRLCDFLLARGAELDTVAPYVYASREDETRVLDFIAQLAAGSIDAVTFTAQPQYKRLRDVAARHGHEAALQAGLQRTLLAAVGPVVATQLEQAGLSVRVVPERTYFMKPLVTALQRYFERTAAHPL